MATKADYVKFNKIRADYIKSREQYMSMEHALQRKYGVGRFSLYASAGERKKIDALAAKKDKLSNSMFVLLDRISPRDWRYGVSAHWVVMDLPWEDAIASGPLSATPHGSYGTDAKYIESLREKPNRAGARGRRVNRTHDTRNRAGGKRVAITYEIVTPESAEQGDAEDRGWIDQEGEQFNSAGEAARFIKSQGATEPSSSHFHPGVWYTAHQYDIDFGTGAEESRSFHPKGFNEKEQRMIFDLVTERRHGAYR